MKYAETHLKSAHESIKQIRENFVEMKTITTSMQAVRTWGSRNKFWRRRLTFVKIIFGELSQGNRTEYVKKIFQVEMYNQLLGILISQLGKRFKVFSVFSEKFTVLSPTSLDNVSDMNFIIFQNTLRDLYKKESFPQQMVSFRLVVQNVIKNTGNVMDLAKAIICKHSTSSSNFPELCIAYILFIFILLSL